jgi:predicted transcriptional regulator of viral defense system
MRLVPWAEIVLQAIEHRGGQASIGQIHEYVLRHVKSDHSLEVTKHAVRSALHWLRKTGDVERIGCAKYKLIEH